MSRRLVLTKDQFEVHTGDINYEVPLPKSDCQVDYSVMADGVVSLYAGFDGKVVPIEHGSKFHGVLLIRDAECLFLKTQDKATIVAIQVYHTERRLTEVNDGKPLAVHVATPPTINVQEMAMRILGQRLEGEAGDIELTPEELAEMYPEDVDTEFGPGFVQLQDDEELYDALKARETNPRKGQERGDQGEGGKGGAPQAERDGPKKGGKPKKSAAPPPEDDSADE